MTAPPVHCETTTCRDATAVTPTPSLDAPASSPARFRIQGGGPWYAISTGRGHRLVLIEASPRGADLLVVRSAESNARLMAATAAWLTPLLRRKQKVLRWLTQATAGAGEMAVHELLVLLEQADATLQGEDLDRLGHVKREPRARRPEVRGGLPSLGRQG